MRTTKICSSARKFRESKGKRQRKVFYKVLGANEIISKDSQVRPKAAQFYPRQNSSRYKNKDMKIFLYTFVGPICTGIVSKASKIVQILNESPNFHRLCFHPIEYILDI